MVSIRQISAALGIVPQASMDAWGEWTIKHQSLVRAYYRTGQLDEADWFYVGISSYYNRLLQVQVTELHPALVQHFYARVLPNLSEYALLVMYLYRFAAQLIDALVLITGREAETIEPRTSLALLREQDADLANEYADNGIDPALANSIFLRRQGETLVDVTAEMAALPETTIVSTVHRFLRPGGGLEDVQQIQLVLLEPEEEALLGYNICELLQRSVIGMLQVQSTIPEEALPMDLPRITTASVTAAWRQVLADPRYLAQAYVRYRLRELEVYDQFFLRGQEDAVAEDGVRQQESEIEAKFLKTLKTVPPHPVPAVAATLKYLRLLLENNEAEGIPVLLPHQLNDEDPVFTIHRTSMGGWSLDLGATTNKGLEHLMAGFAGEVPTDAVIQQRLLAL